MSRRSFCIIGILLFLLFATSCLKSGTITTDREKNPDDNDTANINLMPKEAADNNKDLSEGKSKGILSDNSTLDMANEEDIKLDDKKEVMAKDILSNYSGEKLAEAMKAYPAGTLVNTQGVETNALDPLFYYDDITKDIMKRINGKSYGEDCTVLYEELRYIRVLHKGFDGNTHIGEMIVNKALVQDTIEIFRELYQNNYPIEKMFLVDEYDADDEISMADNNSSAFNFRFIAGTTRLSLHSRGLAIDINPLYNPYITKIDGKTVILPENGSEYADRDSDNSYYIRKGDICYEAFIRKGFTWGGEWKNSKDYQHFQKDIEE